MESPSIANRAVDNSSIRNWLAIAMAIGFGLLGSLLAFGASYFVFPLLALCSLLSPVPCFLVARTKREAIALIPGLIFISFSLLFLPIPFNVRSLTQIAYFVAAPALISTALLCAVQSWHTGKIMNPAKVGFGVVIALFGVLRLLFAAPLLFAAERPDASDLSFAIFTSASALGLGTLLMAPRFSLTGLILVVMAIAALSAVPYLV